MKFYRFILMTAALWVVVWGIKVYAGNLTLTTYYPAPTGNYNNLIVSGIGATGKAVCTKPNKSLGYCSSGVDLSGGCTCN